MRTHMTGWLILLHACLLAITPSVSAVQVPTYAGTVLVNSSQVDFQSSAFADAWLNALARHTGKTEAQLRRIPGLVPQNLSAAIERYHFESVPSEFWPSDQPLYWLHVFASKPRMDQVVSQAKLPTWPAERAEIVTWLLDETRGIPQLVVNGTDMASAYWLQKRAEQAGLPLRWVSNTARDQAAISLQDIRQLSPKVVDYSHETFGELPVLVLKLTPATGQKKPSTVPSGTPADTSRGASSTGPVRWRMAYAMPGESIERKSGMAAGADALARRLASTVRQWHTARERIYPEERQLHEISLSIKGLHDYADVKSVTDYLDRLSVVDRYALVQSRPGQLDLRLRLAVTTDAFLRYLNQGGRFRITQHEPLVLEKR